ncbi:MAG: histidine phosphatase family protein [Alphaproteobacteria bacterium]|nr:histidine phosphatase family protein [Alphaproteobacteria bacterium]
MLTLFLLRHAKSSWSDAGMADFDRPLASRGVKAAPKIGSYMAEAGFAPDLILCSSAQRARETLALVLPFLKEEPTIRITRAIYEADGEEDLLAVLAELAPDESARVMLIGHNPAMQDLAVALAGAGAPDDRAALAQKYPTAGLAVLTFDGADGWAGLAPGAGLLTHFVRPRELE